MKKLIFSKYRQYFFISFALLFLTTVVFLFTNKSSLHSSSTESNEEFNKEINNFFSFFVNNNDAFQNKKIIKIKSGDSIQRILLKEGIPQSEINKIYSNLKIKKNYFVIVCFLSGPTEITLIGTSTAFSINSIYIFNS